MVQVDTIQSNHGKTHDKLEEAQNGVEEEFGSRRGASRFVAVAAVAVGVEGELHLAIAVFVPALMVFRRVLVWWGLILIVRVWIVWLLLLLLLLLILSRVSAFLDLFGAEFEELEDHEERHFVSDPEDRFCFGCMSQSK